MATQDITNDFNIGAEIEGIPDQSYAPDGSYVLKITKAEARMSKGANGKEPKPMIWMACSIVSGPFAGLPVYHNFVWTKESPAAQRFFKENLKKLGVVFSPNTMMSDAARTLVDKVFQATLGHREYNSVISNQIDSFGALVSGGGPVAAPMPGVPTIPTPTPPVAVPTPAPIETEMATTPAAAAPAPAPAAIAPETPAPAGPVPGAVVPF